MNIAGATAATYTIGATRSTDAGSYRVAITTDGGTVTSVASTLTLTPVARIGNSRTHLTPSAPSPCPVIRRTPRCSPPQSGSYTVQISGVGGARGVALVEIYEAP